jgi:hypothetical protein
MEKLGLNRILIIRNGELTSWETTDYILQKGEFGVGFWRDENDNPLAPVVKIGDGERFWSDLPQTSQVLMEDLKLSSSFGRHKVVDGFLDTEGKGKTLLEWIQDALCYEYVESENVRTRPSSEFAKVTVTTDTNTLEPGSKITKITWETNNDLGQHVYGSANRQNEVVSGTAIEAPNKFSVSFKNANGRSFSLSEDLPNGSADVSSIEGMFLREGQENYGKLKGVFSWTEALNIPLSSHHRPIPSSALHTGSRECEFSLDIKPEKAVCFCGGANIDNTGDINTQEILRLSQKLFLKEIVDKPECKVEKGSKMVIIAVRADYDVTSIYNKTAGVEMINTFKKEKDVVVSSNYQSDTAYKIYCFTPAIPYQKETILTLTLEVKANG